MTPALVRPTGLTRGHSARTRFMAYARCAPIDVSGETLLKPTPMMASFTRRKPRPTRSAYPPHIFDQITDILADLVLEDLKQFPLIPTGPRIDRFSRRENTALLTQEGGA